VIKFWAWLYRVTGWYSPWARKAELANIKAFIRYQFGLLADENKICSPEWEILERIEIEFGMWQAHNKFYRKYNWK
jgi:hypothetical protein